MDHTSLPEPRNVSPGYYVPAADASTQTADEDFIFLEPTRDASTQTADEDFTLFEPTRDASTQITEDDFAFLAQIQSTRNISIVSSQSTVDTSETVFSGCQECKNDCDMVNPEVKKFSSSLGASRDFDMSSGSKNHVVQDYMQMVSTAHVQNRDRNESHDRMITDNSQARKRHRLKIGGISGYSLGCDEARRTAMGDDFHPVEPAPRIVSAGTSMPPADPQQTAHSSHQPTQQECTRNAFIEGKNLAEHSEIDTLRTRKTCGKCGERFRRESRFNAHVLNNCDPNPFECDKCGRKFYFESRLKVHYIVHTTEKPLKCDRCDFATKRKKNLDRHINSMHKMF